MRLRSAYVLHCLCGATVESHEPTVKHTCPASSFVIPATPGIHGDFSPWPQIKERWLAVEGWGEAK